MTDIKEIDNCTKISSNIKQSPQHFIEIDKKSENT